MSEKIYSLLVDIEERCKRNAINVPAKQKLQSMWSGIGFRMGSNYFVASMEQVSEVIEPPPLTSLPGVKSWVKGLANVRGRLLPVMDLNFFLKVDSKERETERRVIVISKDKIYSGLLVDEVLGMQHFPIDSYQEQAGSCGELVDPFVKGAYVRNDGAWNMFELFVLADNPDFLKAAV